MDHNSESNQTLDCCKFKLDKEECCGQPAISWGLCEGHEALRTATHDFYKWVEVQRNKVNPDESDEYVFEHRHKFLLLAVSSRVVHAELFFKDNPCQNHALYAGGLSWNMKQEEVLIFKRGKGFVVEGASYGDMLSVAKASIKQAFFDWHKSDKEKSIDHFIRDFPRAIASGTEVPDVVVQRMNPPEHTDW